MLLCRAAGDNVDIAVQMMITMMGGSVSKVEDDIDGWMVM
jgi:hypothetical protein